MDSAESDFLHSNESSKRRWMLASTLLNTLLALAKLGWGIFSGSTVVLADAIHSISDVVGALLVYAAVRLAPHQSRRFPLGLYKLEDMAAVIAGIGVVFAGYEILRSVFVGAGVSESSVPLQTLAFMTVIILIQLVFYIYEKRAAKKLKSPGVSSDVANWMGDIGAGVVVIIGVAGQTLNIPYIQEISVVIIALLIFHSAYEVLRDGLLSLLDASVAQAEENQARQYLEALPYVERVSEVIIRKAGSVFFLKATVQVNTLGLEQAHQWADEIEQQLKLQIPQIEKVTIHYEPVKNTYFRIARLFEQDQKTLAASFGKVQCIQIQDVDTAENQRGKSKIIHQSWVKNPFIQESHGKSMKLAAWLIQQHVKRVELDGADPAMDSSSLRELLSAAGIELVVQ